MTVFSLAFLLLLASSGCAEHHRDPEWHPKGTIREEFRYCQRFHGGVHLPT